MNVRLQGGSSITRPRCLASPQSQHQAIWLTRKALDRRGDTKIPQFPHNSRPATCSSETRQKGLVPHIDAGQSTVKMILEGGQGRGRTADLPLFRRSIAP